MAGQKGVGIYIHIPFCIRKCNYCDFCSFTGQDEKVMREYTQQICLRIKQFTSGRKIYADTVYFGGGTPTLLPSDSLSMIMDTVRDRFELDENAEITVECNPASIDKNGLLAIRCAGINRLSIGLQSANDVELAKLGRLHSFEDFCSTFREAREVGFDNISIDLMYGIPEQTLSSFEETLERVCALSPEHISAYGLKIENGTPFYNDQSCLSLPDEDEEYAMYCLCEKTLKRYGYQRYEISNFAKGGYSSKHNLHYWKLDDYIGFGVAAHSCFKGERYGNSRDLRAFLDGKNIVNERRRIPTDERICEYVMLGLRLEDGLGLDDYESLSGRPFMTDYPQVKKFIEQGFLKEKDGRISFTTKGFFVSNAILSDMLDFEE